MFKEIDFPTSYGFCFLFLFLAECPFGQRLTAEKDHCYFELVDSDVDTAGNQPYTKAQAVADCLDGDPPINVYPAVLNCPAESADLRNTGYLRDSDIGSLENYWLGYTWDGSNYIPDDGHSGFSLGDTFAGWWEQRKY